MPDIHHIIEAPFEYLKARQERLVAGQERHEKRLDEHNRCFKVQVKRMEKQDTLFNQMGELLMSFKEVQVENLEYT